MDNLNKWNTHATNFNKISPWEIIDQRLINSNNWTTLTWLTLPEPDLGILRLNLPPSPLLKSVPEVVAVLVAGGVGRGTELWLRLWLRGSLREPGALPALEGRTTFFLSMGEGGLACVAVVLLLLSSHPSLARLKLLARWSNIKKKLLEILLYRTYIHKPIQNLCKNVLYNKSIWLPFILSLSYNTTYWV